MKSLIKASLILTIAALWAGSAVPLLAATIFNNSANDLVHRFNPGTREVGDEILLAGTDRNLTMFSFEYWGTNSASSTTFAGAVVEARVRFYENTGAPFNGYPTPSPSSFFDSGWFSIGGPTDRSTIVFAEGSDFPSGGLFIPTSDMTWSVQFQGMGATDTLGVDIYSPPVVGSDYPDYWLNNGGWSLMTNGVPMNFAAKMETPEPSAITLSLVGGLSVLTLARRLRRKS